MRLGRRPSQGFYKLTRAGKLRKARSPYTCGAAIRRGRRIGVCRNPVTFARERCRLHRS